MPRPPVGCCASGVVDEDEKVLVYRRELARGPEWTFGADGRSADLIEQHGVVVERQPGRLNARIGRPLDRGMRPFVAHAWRSPTPRSGTFRNRAVAAAMIWACVAELYGIRDRSRGLSL